MYAYYIKKINMVFNLTDLPETSYFVLVITSYNISWRFEQSIKLMEV